MTKNKYKFWSLLLSILFMNLALRYPSEGYERGGGGDSWDYHMQINQIINQGEIIWIINPLSYYGHFLPYTEVGSTVFISSLQSVIDLSVSTTILFVSFFIGLAGFFLSFVLGKSIFTNKYLALIFSATFSLSVTFVDVTTWMIHPRYMLGMMIFLISFFILFLKTRPASVFPTIICIILVIIAVPSIHRSGIFIIPFLLVSIILHVLDLHNKKTLSPIFMRIKWRIFYLFLTLLIFNFSIYLEAEESFNFRNHINSIFNWLVESSMKVGVVSIFGCLFFISLTHLKRLTYAHLFFLTHLFVMFSLTLFTTWYGIYLFYEVIYFYAITLGVGFLLEKYKYSFRASFLFIVFLLITSSLPDFAHLKDKPGSGTYVDDDDWLKDIDTPLNLHMGLYMNYYIDPEKEGVMYSNRTGHEMISAYAETLKHTEKEIDSISSTDYKITEFVFTPEIYTQESGIGQKPFYAVQWFSNHGLNSAIVNNYIAYNNYNYFIIYKNADYENPPPLFVDIFEDRYKFYSNDLHDSFII